MKKVLAVATLALLVACSNDVTSSKNLGKAENCTVYEINLAGQSVSRPLYLAKCTDTDLASITYATGGKSSVQISTTTMVEQESEVLKKKKAALGKLTQEERKLLGLE
jgi:hypothetical protein